MTWTSFHSRGEVLRTVEDAVNARRDGILPMDIDGVAENARRKPECGVVQQASERGADRFRRRRAREREARPALRDADGIVGLIAAMRDDEHRQALQECRHHRAMPAMGHDKASFLQDLEMRRAANHDGVRGRRQF